MAAPTKWTYSFGGGSAEGSIGMKALLGGKGAGLAEMSRIGLNVPPGITITTELCQEYHRTGSLPESLWSSVVEGIERIEKLTGLTFCPDVATRPGTRPLLVSVRSGAAASMPGMMDTVLNVGLNLEIATDFAAHAERPRHAWDCYRRLISMYGDVVAGVPKATFEAALAAAKQAAGVSADVELDAASLRGLCGAFTSAYAAGTGAPFPTDPWAMLRASIEGVVRSWDNPRAVKYRALNRLTGLRGTAVTVQAMVFGNADARSGSGVLFSRNPSTGERGLWGEVLMDAQGEDVVSGVRTPSPLAALEAALPAAYADLVASVAKLEAHCRDMQDVEFTVQRGELFMLQCRDGKRTGPAALRIAVDMVAEGAVTTEDAVRRLVTPGHLDQVLHPTFVEVAPEAAAKRAAALLARGMAASPGAAVGRAVFSSADAEAWHARGERVILLRPETAAEDVGGMFTSEAVVTSHGGMTSHAAVVARGWGRPAVVGAGDLLIDTGARTATVKSRAAGVTVREGDWLSVNGTTGDVFLGRFDTAAPTASPHLRTVVGWAHALCPIGVRVNADSERDVAAAAPFPGVDGVGLCRTEHMFWGPERISHMRAFILAPTAEQRTAAAAALFPHQRGDFGGLFRAAAALPRAASRGPVPVTIRFLDPPLHEYLPLDAAGQRDAGALLGLSPERVASLVAALRNANPLIGYRGVRVGITHPEVIAMQARAAFAAALDVAAEAGGPLAPGAAPGTPPRVLLQLMTPMTTCAAEVENQRAVVEAAAVAVLGAVPGAAAAVPFRVGTMVETPRACLVAGSLVAAPPASAPPPAFTHPDWAGRPVPPATFLSFGSNDLTACTFGYSRDDAPKWVPALVTAGVLPDDPFTTLDGDGVGELVTTAITRARAAEAATWPTGAGAPARLEIGLCGEHGGEERSVAWLVRQAAPAGLDYVSVSPFRVPVAVLAAAQSALAMRAEAAAGGGSGGRGLTLPADRTA